MHQIHGQIHYDTLEKDPAGVGSNITPYHPSDFCCRNEFSMQVTMFRYITKEEFRVLTAVEMGMRPGSNPHAKERCHFAKLRENRDRAI